MEAPQREAKKEVRNELKGKGKVRKMLVRALSLGKGSSSLKPTSPKEPPRHSEELKRERQKEKDEEKENLNARNKGQHTAKAANEMHIEGDIGVGGEEQVKAEEDQKETREENCRSKETKGEGEGEGSKGKKELEKIERKENERSKGKDKEKEGEKEEEMGEKEGEKEGEEEGEKKGEKEGEKEGEKGEREEGLTTRELVLQQRAAIQRKRATFLKLLKGFLSFLFTLPFLPLSCLHPPFSLSSSFFTFVHRPSREGY